MAPREGLFEIVGSIAVVWCLYAYLPNPINFVLIAAFLVYLLRSVFV